MSKFLHKDDKDDNYNVKAIAMPPVFPENSRAKNYLIITMQTFMEKKLNMIQMTRLMYERI